MFNQDQTSAYQAQKPSKKQNKTIILILIAIVLITCLCITIIAAVVYFDPFNLGLIGRLRGGYDSIAAAIPEDTDIYVSMDMLKFLSEDTRSVFDAFAQGSGDPEITNQDEFIQQMDESLLNEFGITFSGDIQPWIGQYIGIGLFDISSNEFGEPNTEQWLFGIEARSRKAADSFISKLVHNLSEKTGTPFSEQEINGTVIYDLVTSNQEPLAITRKGGHVFLSSSAALLIQVLDTAPGETLAKNEQFMAATEELPNTRMMTAFISQDVFGAFTGLIGQDVMDTFSLPGNQQNLGLSLSLVDEGIEFNVSAVYDLNSLSQSQMERLSSPGATGQIAEQIPPTAIGFMTGSNFVEVWEYLSIAIQEGNDYKPGEFEETMQALEDEVGLNPDKDLFPLLDEEWGIAILRERDTFISEQIDIPLGLLAIAGTSNEAQLDQNVGKIVDKLSGLGLVMADEIISENMTYYELKTFLFGEPMMAFGVNDAQLFLATDAKNLETSLETASSLATTTAYQSAWGTLSQSMDPILYLDIQQLVMLLPQMSFEDLALLRPVRSIALAGSPMEGSIKKWALLVFVETK